MSSVTVLQPPAFHTAKVSSPNCQQCGADIPYETISAAAEDAQRRISELEAQVRILTGKATAAVDKLADYEDQLHQLKSTQPASSGAPSPQITTQAPSRPTSSSEAIPAPANPHTRPSSITRAKLPSRLTNLLRPPSAPPTPTHPPPQSITPPLPSYTPPLGAHKLSSSSTDHEPHHDLLMQLRSEQTLRQAAESKLSNSHQELEELSTQLFTEANEMVAQERRARAQLERRVELLERRDREKRDRLGELERRVGRVERVKGLLNSYA